MTDFPDAATNYDPQFNPVDNIGAVSSSAGSDYWAAKDSDQLVGSLSSIIKGYYDRLARQGLHYLWRRAYFTYYGIDYVSGAEHGTSGITFGGAEGELAFLKVNHYRSLLQNILNMTTSQLPRWEPRAVNSDVQSAEQTAIARGVLDYLMRDQNLDEIFKDAGERALVYGEGFIWMSWDVSGGEPKKEKNPDGTQSYTGAMWFRALSPRAVIRNTRRAPKDNEWYVVRVLENKYSLAAKYPEHAEKLKGLQGDYSQVEAFDYDYIDEDIGTTDSGDDIPMYHFYHKRTPAMPEGRYMQMAGTIALVDGPLPYREMPVYRIAGGDIMGSGWGYASGFDLLGPQEGYDSVYSMILTGLDAHGVSSVVYSEDSELGVTDLGGGMRGIRVKTMDQLPQSLDLLSISDHTYKFLELTQSAMQLISGVNEVARGQSQSGESGAHAALMQSMAIMANTGFQNSYRNLLEDVGTGVIRILADYAEEPQIALIVGSDQRYKIQSFKGEDIAGIDRVQVDLGNPILSTTAGRFDLAMQLMDKGMVKTPEQLWTVFETGRLESVYKGDYGQLETAKRENERLAKGPQIVPVPVPDAPPMPDPQTGQMVEATRNIVDGVMAILTDNHQLHIRQHAEVLNNPDARSNPTIMQAVLTHIQDHMYLSQTTPPDMALALGNTPPMGPPGGVGPMPPEGMAAGPGAAGGTGNISVGGEEGGPGSPPPPQAAGGEMPAGLPSLPKNPATGETATPMG